MRLRSGLLLALSGCLWISAAEHERRTDRDGDGVPVDRDCDDEDPQVSPELPEQPCDEVDNDCDRGSPDGPAAIGEVTFDTIQGAIEVADPGDTIVLCPGRYDEAVVVSKGVTLTGSTAPEATVLDATGRGGAVVTVTGGGATLRRLMLTGGTGGPNTRPDLVDGETIGGGLHAVGATGEVLLEDVVITGNSADAGAGVFAPASATLRVVRSDIRENAAADAGGGVVVPLVASFEDALVASNTAERAGGGVLLLDAAVASADDATAVADNAAPYGGGVWVGPVATWTGGAISDNQGATQGGGAFLDGGTLAGVTVDRNISAQGGGVAGGGVLDDVEVSGNDAAGGGGVLVLDDLAMFGAVTVADNVAQTDAGGGVLVLGGTLTVSAASVEIRGNRAEASAGGGIAALGGGLDLYALAVSGNRAARGGGIAVETAGGCAGCRFAFTAVEIAGNAATAHGGGFWTDTSIALNACFLASNTADGDGGGLYVADGSTVVSGSVFDGNSAVGQGGGFALASTAGESEISTQTLFVDNAAEDGAAIHLGPGASLLVTASQVTSSHATSGTGAAVSLAQGGATSETRYVSQSETSYSGNDGADVHVGGIVRDNEPDDADFTCTWGVVESCAP